MLHDDYAFSIKPLVHDYYHNNIILRILQSITILLNMLSLIVQYDAIYIQKDFVIVTQYSYAYL